ncbi:tRNA(Met) cytidine acetyltransferase TmcA [Aestuariirhabdus sp. LZHN29]|uniref:tRNA(Met) cytidine acetyltransferase TmcA n=1 Tax=Aestuariirhabdus sp. LZHN29 TaxID=3417462 RepID=UPI003CEF724D
MAERDFLSLCHQLQHQARLTRQRRLLVLSGSRAWSRHYAKAWGLALLAQAPHAKHCWVTAASDCGCAQVIAPAKHGALLGSEWDLLVFDAWSGLNPDALGAACGAVCGGGLLLLLAPPLAQWPEFPDPDYERLAIWPQQPDRMRGQFLQWMVSRVLGGADSVLCQQGTRLPDSPRQALRPASPLLNDSSGCLTQDQQRSVIAIEEVAQTHHPRPLVIRSDRGRGKSAALGIAAANLLRVGTREIAVCAPRRSAADALFANARKRLGLPPASGDIHWIEGRIRFFAPDELLRQRPAADLLLVDEAAAIPSPLLEAMLDHYPQVVYASTIHGYEGSGRGFALRFQQVLERRAPGWRELTLQQPIRWSEQDPLERWCFESLLLDADCDAPEVQIDSDSVELRWVTQPQLGEQPELLRQLFGLLVMAHYRTSASDLRHLLDGPNLEILLLLHQGQLLGAALLAQEGGFDETLAREIWLGRRRPRGHLLAQSLATHGGLREAPTLRCLRVMRIAVHPQCHSRGLGSRLLEEAECGARQMGCDYLGSSFGVTARLLPFWLRAGLTPLRLGVRREASSGSYSVMVAKGISEAGAAMVALGRSRFVDHFPRQLAEHYRELEPELEACLLSGAEWTAPVSPHAAQEQWWSDLISFADGQRLYETCSVVLQEALSLWLENGELGAMSDADNALLQGKVLHHHSWKALASACPGQGRQQLQLRLRGLYARQLDRLLPAEFECLRSGAITL